MWCKSKFLFKILKMFIVKIHDSENSGNIISVVDKEIINKEIVEGNKILDLTSDFYKGEEMDEETTLNFIKKASHLNVVGEKIVTLLKKIGYVEETMKIANVPFAQIILNN